MGFSSVIHIKEYNLGWVVFSWNLFCQIFNFRI